MTDLSKVYYTPVTIASYDGDLNRRIKPSSILKYQQEIGELHLDSVGLKYSYLYDKGMVFLLTRAMGIIYKAPCFEDKVTLSTYSCGTKGANFIRGYEFIDGDGNVLIHSVSLFVLTDPQGHNILRPSAADIFDIRHNDSIKEKELPQRIILPDGTKKEDERVIRFTDIDYNGHLNNAVYADIAMDYAPIEMSSAPLKRYDINFLGEAKLGDSLNISTHTGGGDFYISASHERGKCFTARLVFDVK